MISKVRGVVREVLEDKLTLAIDPFEVEVLIPENARRSLQSRLNEAVELHTILDIEGNQMGGSQRPRLIGFLSAIDREFFDIFCSVDGIGVRKALRAMVRPVRELARLIQDQDVKTLSTYPGIGEATAERVVAKLRRKVGKFALIVAPGAAEPVSKNGQEEPAEPDVVRDTYQALLSVGHSDSEARARIDRVLAGSKRKFRTVADLIDAIYQHER
ncbi:MAG: Holliday junction branch migration protein RuvA [Isosphaeraceae bacterium]